MDAMVAYRKSLELDSSQPDLLLNLANLHAADGNHKEAITVIPSELPHMTVNVMVALCFNLWDASSRQHLSFHVHIFPG